MTNDTIRTRAVVLSVFVGLMWVVRAIDTLIPGQMSSAGVGVIPRTIGGLYNIPIAPFIHVDWDHLISNTLPLVILGVLILVRGTFEFIFVVFVSAFVSGFGTWLFGEGNAQHVGASGIVFGFFGYLVFRTAFDRKISSAVIALIVAIAYGSAMTWSLIPEESVSWSGHFFGFIGGFAAARLRYPHRPRNVTPEMLAAVIEFPAPPQSRSAQNH
ncbi:MAG TPA: rhomboid family intramembrane serine protease [Thermoanaerobaculia bacterium]|nr:rhomboid family intramembrane serine protease [Thermoanaerobaculia bacterium]